MSIRHVAPLVLLLLAGCSGPANDFTGVYSGVVTQTTTCGTDAPRSTLFQLTMALVQNNNAVTDQDPSCPGVTGTAMQNVVTVSPFVCPATKDVHGNTDIVSFSSGTWTLNGDGSEVAVSLTGTLTVETPAAASTTCATVWNGTLYVEPM